MRTKIDNNCPIKRTKFPSNVKVRNCPTFALGNCLFLPGKNAPTSVLLTSKFWYVLITSSVIGFVSSISTRLCRKFLIAKTLLQTDWPVKLGSSLKHITWDCMLPIVHSILEPRDIWFFRERLLSDLLIKSNPNRRRMNNFTKLLWNRCKVAPISPIKIR